MEHLSHLIISLENHSTIAVYGNRILISNYTLHSSNLSCRKCLKNIVFNAHVKVFTEKPLLEMVRFSDASIDAKAKANKPQSADPFC